MAQEMQCAEIVRIDSIHFCYDERERLPGESLRASIERQEREEQITVFRLADGTLRQITTRLPYEHRDLSWADECEDADGNERP